MVLDRFTSSSSAYNIAGAARLHGNLDKDALKQSLNEILRRHELLVIAIMLLPHAVEIVVCCG